MKPITVTLSAIKCLAPFMADPDSIRFALFGIRIEREPNHVTLIATNGSVMGVLELAADVEGDGFKPYALTLPGSAILVLLPYCESLESRVHEIEISEDDGKIKVECSGSTFRFPRQSETYPNWRKPILDTYEPATSFLAVNATLLAKIADSRKAIANGTAIYFIPSGDYGAVRFHYGVDTKFFGLLMPMRSPDSDKAPFKP